MEAKAKTNQGTIVSKRGTMSKTNILTKTAILSSIAFIVMLFELPIPFFPAFLKLDFSDIPALIGAFAINPLVGVLIQLIKNILHLVIKTSTGGVGELGNFIVGGTFVFVAGAIYHINKSKKMAIAGCLVATFAMAAVGALFNTYVLIPFYANIMPIDVIISMGSAVTSKIHDIPTLVLYGVTPFNIFKGLVISGVTILIYKKIKPLLQL